MSAADNAVQITYNGEIYNFKELRDILVDNENIQNDN